MRLPRCGGTKRKPSSDIFDVARHFAEMPSSIVALAQRWALLSNTIPSRMINIGANGRETAEASTRLLREKLRRRQSRTGQPYCPCSSGKTAPLRVRTPTPTRNQSHGTPISMAMPTQMKNAAHATESILRAVSLAEPSLKAGWMLFITRAPDRGWRDQRKHQ